MKIHTCKHEILEHIGDMVDELEDGGNGLAVMLFNCGHCRTTVASGPDGSIYLKDYHVTDHYYKDGERYAIYTKK